MEIERLSADVAAACARPGWAESDDLIRDDRLRIEYLLGQVHSEPNPKERMVPNHA